MQGWSLISKDEEGALPRAECDSKSNNDNNQQKGPDAAGNHLFPSFHRFWKEYSYLFILQFQTKDSMQNLGFWTMLTENVEEMTVLLPGWIFVGERIFLNHHLTFADADAGKASSPSIFGLGSEYRIFH